MDDFLDTRAAHERGFQIIAEPTVTLCPNGTFTIVGGSWTGGTADDVRWMVIDRARLAIAALAGQCGPRVPLGDRR